MFSRCCSFSWHAQGISRGLTHGVLAGPHLYQSLILIHPQVETVPWEGRLPPRFGPVGDFACYTAGWQEKQALGFIRFHWSILVSPLVRPQVLIICELKIWLGCDVRLVGGGQRVATETKRKEGSQVICVAGT